MTSEQPVRSWDVVVVPFPYSDRLAEKRRPALVVSSDALHRQGYLWIAMITGAGKASRAGDVLVRDLESAGLPGSSIVRISKLGTIELDRIVRKIGSLADGERAAARNALTQFLAE